MYNVWKCADAVYQKLSKSVHACRNYSLPKLARFLRHCVVRQDGTNVGIPRRHIEIMARSALGLCSRPPWNHHIYRITMTICYRAMLCDRQIRYNAIVSGIMDVHMPYLRVLFRMTLSELEWLSEILNDTKRIAASLQQLSSSPYFVSWSTTRDLSRPPWGYNPMHGFYAAPWHVYSKGYC